MCSMTKKRKKGNMKMDFSFYLEVECNKLFYTLHVFSYSFYVDKYKKYYYVTQFFFIEWEEKSSGTFF